MRLVKRVLLSFLMLTLFTLYHVGVTMFTHVHYINGVMLVHSHPSQGKHTHSKTAIVIIDRLSTFHSLEAETHVCIEPVCSLLCYVEVQAEKPIIEGIHLQMPSLRAPPVAIIG